MIIVGTVESSVVPLIPAARRVHVPLRTIRAASGGYLRCCTCGEQLRGATPEEAHRRASAHATAATRREGDP